MAIEYKSPISVNISGVIPGFTTGVTSTLTHSSGSQLRMTGFDSQVSTAHTSGTVTLVRGFTTTFSNSTGAVTTAHGLSALFSLTSAPSNLIGVYVSMSCGTSTNASADWQGFYAALSNSSTVIRSVNFYDTSFSNSGGTITTVKGLNLGGWGTTGTVTTSYGIYADTTIDKGATKYFIYSLSVSPSLFSGTVTTNPTLAANTSRDGNVLLNSTVASTGNQMYSPRNRYTGQGWKTTATAASQTVDLITELRPVQGAANPSFIYVWAGQINASGYTDRMMLDSAGSLGIGVTPAYRLDVGAQARIVGTSGVVGAIGSGTYSLSLQNNSPSSWLEILNSGGVGKGAFFGLATNAFQLWNYQAGEISFFTNTSASTGTERMRITNDGLIGIGTIAPGVFVDAVRLSNSGTITDYPILRAYNSLATQGDGASTFNRSAFRMEAGNGTVQGNFLCTYESGGSFSTGLYIRTTTNHPIYFMTNNTTRLTVLSTGQVSFRFKPRTPNIVASAATITFDLAADDVAGASALAVNVTLAAPTGTPDQEQRGEFLLKDNGTARTITYNAVFRDVGVIRPGSTVVSKWLRIGWKYNSVDSKYDIVAVAQE